MPDGHSPEPDAPTPDEIAAVESRVGQAEDLLRAVGEAVEGHTAWLTDLQRWVSSCVETFVQLGAEPPAGGAGEVRGRVDLAARALAWTEIQTVMSWIRDVAELPREPLVTVVIATHDRLAQLRRALGSVLDQSYRHVDIVIVDDSVGTETAEWLADHPDRRVRRVATPARRGAPAAFNLGLDAARGEIIAALDDDNLMHRDWVRSVVWGFAQRPEVNVLYGARIVESSPDVRPGSLHGFPAFEFSRYDRRRHEQVSYIDRNVMAIRSSCAAVRYDESLPRGVDWDLTLRLFAEHEPLPLPAIACYYRTLGHERISTSGHAVTLRAIRSRAHRSRPLRVHAHVDRGGEAERTSLQDLSRAGVELTVSGAVAFAPETAQRWPGALAAALAELHPDVLLLDSQDPDSETGALLIEHQVPVTTIGGRPARGPTALGPVDRSAGLEPGLREALTAWLFARG